MAEAIAPDLSQKQQLFLDAFRLAGTIRKAAAAARVGRTTVNKWRANNINGFRARFEEATDDFADEIEEMLFERIRAQGPGHNPTLAIFMLKALRPLKYRELTQVQDDSARDLLMKLESWQSKKPDVSVEDKPEVELSPLEQVERLFKDNSDAR